MLRRTIGWALILTTILASFACSALADLDATVFCPKMTVYDAPRADGKVLGSLKSGVQVRVDAFTDAWARVTYKDKVGYARVEDLLALDVVEEGVLNEATKIRYITRDNRKPRWGKLGKGVRVYVRGRKGDKLLVSNEKFTVLGYLPEASVTVDKK